MSPTQCFVSYVRDGAHRVRIFPNEGNMDRWIRKFERDAFGDSESWLNFAVIGAERIRSYDEAIQIVNFGE